MALKRRGWSEGTRDKVKKEATRLEK